MKHSSPPPSAARRAAMLGILCALAGTLSFLEGLLPALPLPGAKLGLANVVTMFALSSMGLPAALAVTLAKTVFALFRGGSAFILSLSGGLLSTLTMALVWRLWRRHLSFVGLGILGAVAHNAGQLLAAVVLIGPSLFYYAPWLLLMALGTGFVTGLVLNGTIPTLSRWQW